jgi:Zn-dependent protease
MSATDGVFYIAILIMSIVIHEVSHGFMAERFGDDTARNAGRLTMNPLKHLDIFGSIVLPAILILSQTGFVFGWAKPVPYNPNNLSDRKWGTVWIAVAGVLANFLIALFFGLVIRFSVFFELPSSFYFITSAIVIINLALGIFNLIPIPPLDGSKILFSLLPSGSERLMYALEQYSLFILLFFVIFLSDYLYPVLALLFKLMTGFAL